MIYGLYKVDENSSSALKSFIGRMQNMRGEEFNKNVSIWIKDNTPLVVYENVPIKDEDKDYGDVDVLAIDFDRKKIFSIECKSLYYVSNPRDILNEVERFIGGDNSWMEKHRNREKYLKNNLNDLEKKLNNFYIKNPDILNINDKINRISIEISKTILLNKDSDKIEKLNLELDNLKKEKQELLNKLNVKKDFFVPDYSCKLCNDTGYLIDDNTVICTCLKQKLLNVQYNKSNISSLEQENFDNFNIDLFSVEKDEKKYNSNISFFTSSPIISS